MDTGSSITGSSTSNSDSSSSSNNTSNGSRILADSFELIVVTSLLMTVRLAKLLASV